MKRFALKRITALVLALVMTLSLLPMTVWATEGEKYTPLFWLDVNGVYHNSIDMPIEQKPNNGGYRVNLYVKNGDSYSAIDEGTFGNETIQKLSNDIGFFGWSDNIGVFWNTENTVAGTESGVVFTVGELKYRVNLKVIAVSLDEEAAEFIAQYAKDADGNIIDISDPSSVSWDNNNRIEQGLWYWQKMSTEQKAAVNAQLGDVTFDDMLAVAVQKIFPTATKFISLFLATGEMYFTAITAENLWTLKNAASYFNYLSNEVKAEVDGAVNTNFAPIRTESTTLSFADIAAASDFIHNFVSVGGDEKTLITKLDNTSTGDDVWPISRGESVWGTLTAVQKTAVNKSLANADSNAQTYEQMLEYAKTQTGGSGDGNGNSGGESALLGVPFDTTAVKELSFDETVAILKNETGEFNFTNSNPNLDTLQEIWAFSRSIDTYWSFDETFKKLETDYSYTVAQGFNDVVQAGWYIGGYLSTLDPAVYTWEAKLDKLDSNLTDYDTFVYAYELVDSYFASHMTLTKEQRDLVDTYIETDLDDGYAKATAAIKAQSDETVVEQFKIKFLQDNLTNEMITADNVMLIRNHPDGGGALNPWNVMGGEGIFRDILSKTQQDAVDTLCGGEGCYYELLRLAQAYWIAHLDKNISAENALAIVKSTEIGSALITLINNALLYGRPVQLAISAEVTEAMDATDKAALDNAVPSGYEVENYQDLGVTVTVDGQTTDVTQTNGKVTVKVGKAENGKEYKMVRKHGDKVDVLPVTVDSNGDIYVESDQFSSYALVSTSSNNGPFSNLSDAAKAFVDEYIDYNLFPNGDGYYVQVFPKGAVVCWDSDDVNDCYYINEASKTAARAVFAAYALVDTNLYTISNNKRTVAGEQMVLVKLDDTANFEWEDGTVAELQYTFTIAKAPLTITANAATITYGAAPANAGVEYKGFVNSETESALTGTLSYSYDYTQYGDVGTYAITPAGLSSANYEITFVNGALTVEKKEIGIEWGSTDLTYSGEAQAPTATATGAVNGDVLTLTVTGAQMNASADAYTATVTAITGEKAENYSLPSVATVEFTIAKATQAAPVVVGVNETVSAKNDGKITDVTNAMEYSVDGVNYNAIADGKLENLAPATYYVRYAETENRLASDVVTVVIAAGKKVTVTFAVNGGNAIEAIKDLAYGDKVTAPTEPKKAGYTFAGWFSDKACTKAWDFDKDTVSADVMLYAKWNAIPVVYPPYVPETPSTTPVEKPTEPKPTTPAQPTTPPAEVTVPVSGEENTINVEASVSGSTATIDKVDMTKLEGVIGDDVAVGTVTVDFSVLESAEVIEEVEIPAEVVKEIAEAVADPNNDAESLEIVLSDGASIEFDAAALAEKVSQAGGADITISIKHAVENILSAAQQATVGDRVAFDINVTSGGVHISDMGGKITIHAPYELRDGETAEGIVVCYVDDEGNKEKCETSYDSVKKRVNWKTDHLSVYMIAHEAPATDDAPAVDNTPADDMTPSDSGNSVGLWIGVALAVLVVAIIVVVILIKRKKA